MTTAEQLDEINTAITAILARGQSVNAQGRGLTRAALPELLKERRHLEAKLARETRGPIVVSNPEVSP